MDDKEAQMMYLLSFLQILIIRAGGELVIENLSEVAGSTMTLEMELQRDKDRVILRSKMAPIDPKAVL